MSLEAREALRSAIHRSGRWLDDGRYDDYVGLFATDGEYRLEALAPEVRRPMTWMALDRDGLRQLLAAAPGHQWPIGERTHLIAVDSIELEGGAATVAATFCVLRTDDAGRLDCYAAGRYDDLWIAGGEGWRLRRRVATLRNRLLAVPSPIPV
jgi:3-phenylpropionate/cinnamic acid dioxygenase small subunit